MATEKWEKIIKEKEVKNLSKEDFKEIIQQLEQEIRNFPEIYIIQCEEYYKIGQSYDAWKRMKNLETMNPYPITLIFHLEVNDANKTETKLHHLFASKRIKGEWFKLTTKELKRAISIIKQEHHK